MNKPFSLVCEEFKLEMANLINSSNLPICVIEIVLQNYLTEVNNIVKSQYKNDREKYEKFLSQESEGG